MTSSSNPTDKLNPKMTKEIDMENCEVNALDSCNISVTCLFTKPHKHSFESHLTIKTVIPLISIIDSSLITTLLTPKFELDFSHDWEHSIAPSCTSRTGSLARVFTFGSRYLLTSIFPIKGIHCHAFYRRKLEQIYVAKIALRAHPSIHFLPQVSMQNMPWFLPLRIKCFSISLCLLSCNYVDKNDFHKGIVSFPLNPSPFRGHHCI